MGFKLTNDKLAGGFTLIELMVGTAVGSLLLAVVAAFFLFSLRSFASISNYTDLNQQDRYANDLITRDIRNALRVESATPNKLVLRAAPVGGTNTVTYIYNSAAQTLTRTDNSTRKTLLTGVSSCSFGLYRRPIGNARYDVFLAGNVNNAKLVGYRWTCGRQVAGQAKSESVQTAKVSMRNE